MSIVLRIAEALSALEHLHRTVGEVRWLDGLRHHRERSRAHTLAPSFPDWLRNSGLDALRLDSSSHSLQPVHVSWANELQRMLVSRLDRLGDAVMDPDSSEPEWERPTVEPPLPGWTCLICGNTEVGAADAEEWIARSLVPFHVGDRALQEYRLLTEDVLERRLIGTEGARADLVDRTRLSGVQITERLSAMTVCTVCGSGDTQACSWVAAGGGLHRVDPHGRGPDPTASEGHPATLDEVERLLEAEGGTRVAAGLWHLPGPDTRSWLRTQEEVMELLRHLPSRLYLCTTEDVDQEARVGQWKAAGPGVWEIPPGESTGILLRGPLHAGGWQMGVADAAPAHSFPKLFEDVSDEVVRGAFEAGVHAVIDAWHDNTEWRVLLPARAD